MSKPVKFSFLRSELSWPHSVVVCTVGAALVAAGLLMPASTPRSSAAGATVAAINPDALDAMLGQLKQQQEQMTANQTKIETQLAALKEELRQVKIYSARAGSGGRR